MSHRIRVGVLRGGPSNEYDVSLKSGAAVLDALRKKYEDKYHARDIFIDKKGRWHFEGVEVKPHDLIHKLDVVFNALHGAYGEDGKVQSIFEHHGIPFTGSGSLGSALGMNKILSKKIFANHELKVPFGKEIFSKDVEEATDEIIKELFQSFMMPAVVKPASSGSSVGVSIVKYYNELGPALKEAAKHSDSVLIEEFIPGIEATCGVVEGFRGHELYALPPIEIRPATAFFDYEAKYAGKSTEIVPSTFPQKIKMALEDLAKKVHNALGLKHYSRTDFIVHPRRGIYVLEVNTLPGLTSESLVPKALKAVGCELDEFVDHLVGLAMKREK